MIIEVVASPAGQQERIVVRENIYHVKLKAKPINGQANKQLQRLLARHFNIPLANIEIKRGLHSRQKLVNIIL